MPQPTPRRLSPYPISVRGWVATPDLEAIMYYPPTQQTLPNLPIIMLSTLPGIDPLFASVWQEFATIDIRMLRKYACRHNSAFREGTVPYSLRCY
jgi:hypothetical protein